MTNLLRRVAIEGESLLDPANHITVPVAASGIFVADSALEVARGNVPGTIKYTKSGRVPDVDTGTTPEDVWSSGGTYTGQSITNSVAVRAVSSDVNDDAAGTGMRTLDIVYLANNTSTAYATQTVSLDGTNTVALPQNLFRVLGIFGNTYGSGGINAGNITVEVTSNSQVVTQLPAGFGLCQCFNFTVPAGTTAYMTRLQATMARANGAAGSGVVSLRARVPGSGGYNAQRTYDLTTGYPVIQKYDYPIVFTAGTDIKATVDDVSDNNSSVNFEADIVVVDN